MGSGMASITAAAKRVLPRSLQLKAMRARSKIKSLRRGSLSFADRPPDPSPFPFIVDHENPLEALGAKYDPSKRWHNYLVYYWLHFRDIRLKVTRVLEVGVFTGESIQMWEEFFPNVIIYGIDIDMQKIRGGQAEDFNW